jgi:hypothetical protein
MSSVDIDGSMIVTFGPKSGAPATAFTTGAAAPASTGPAPMVVAKATAAATMATLRLRERVLVSSSMLSAPRRGVATW